MPKYILPFLVCFFPLMSLSLASGPSRIWSVDAGPIRLGLYCWMYSSDPFFDLRIANRSVQFSAWWVAGFGFTLLVVLCVGIFFGAEKADSKND